MHLEMLDSTCFKYIKNNTNIHSYNAYIWLILLHECKSNIMDLSLLNKISSKV